MPTGEINLEPPPELPPYSGEALTRTMIFLPVALAMTAGAFVLLTAAPAPMLYLVLGLYLVAQVAVLAGGLARSGRRPALDAARRDYLRHLGVMRREVRMAAGQQRAALEWSHPRPGLLWAIARSGRLWERRPCDHDFGHARIGTGRQDLAVRLVAPETGPIEDLEPLTTGSLRRFGRAHSTVPDLPVRVPLTSFGRVALSGDREAAYGLARAMIVQLAGFHAPGDLRISVCAAPDRMPSWEWVKWLPHALHPCEVDAAGPVRLVARSLTRLEVLLADELAGRPPHRRGWAGELPFHLVIVDGGHAPADSRLAAEGIDGTSCSSSYRSRVRFPARSSSSARRASSPRSV